MLIDQDANVAAFRPPPVEELTDEERGRLRETVGGVVEAWRGGVEIGLEVGGVRQVQAGDDAGEAPGDVWFVAQGAPVALGLSQEAAAGLLCVNLGAPMRDTSDPNLSEIDCALLDAWASRALPELVNALGAGPAGKALRRNTRPPDLTAKAGGAVAADLTFAAGRRAGTILIGAEIARANEGEPCETFADHLNLLLHAGLRVDAHIVAEAVPLRELLALETGDVLLLGDKATVLAELTAGEGAVASGRPGARAGRRAIRIEGDVLADREDRLGETSDGF